MPVNTLGTLGGTGTTLGTLGNSFRGRVTYYAPGPGDRMEGGFETSRPHPVTGQAVPVTLDDVRRAQEQGREPPLVTIASDPSRYGQRINMGDLTYKSPLDGKTYTVPGVAGVVHDTGSAFKGRPDKLDVAAGDFRGWSPAAASAYVTADGGTRTVTPDGWQANVGPASAGVGYVNAASVPQGATTDPAELVRQDGGGFSLGRFLQGFDFTPARPIAQAQPFAFQRPVFGMQPLGARRA